MTLFLVGGGPTDNLADVHDVFAASVGARTRGRRARVLYVSAGLPDETRDLHASHLEPLTARLAGVQVTHVHLLPVGADGTDHTVWPAHARDVDGLVIAGGHTPSYLAGLAPHRADIAHLVRNDVPFLGYSAGAQVTSRHASVGGWRVNGRAVASQRAAEGLDELQVVDGLNLVTPLIVTHNDTTQSESTIIHALEHNLSRTGVAIDEDTCLVIDPITGRTAHYGQGRIRWFSREAAGVVVKTQYPD